MNPRDLTASQAADIYQRLRSSADYLVALERRRAERQFAADDRLYSEVRAVCYAMQLLCKDLHRLACGPFYPGDAT